MKKYLLMSVLSLTVLSLGCGEGATPFPQDDMKLAELNIDEQRTFCQARHDFKNGSIDAEQACTFKAIIATDEPLVLDTEGDEGDEGEDDDESPDEAEKKDDFEQENLCESRRQKCVHVAKLQREEFTHRRGRTCGFTWDCAATVREARECIKAMLEANKERYSDLQLSCDPSTWQPVRTRIANLEKKGEERRASGAPPWPPACEPVKECIRM